MRRMEEKNGIGGGGDVYTEKRVETGMQTISGREENPVNTASSAEGNSIGLTGPRLISGAE